MEQQDATNNLGPMYTGTQAGRIFFFTLVIALIIGCIAGFAMHGNMVTDESKISKTIRMKWPLVEEIHSTSVFDTTIHKSYNYRWFFEAWDGTIAEVSKEDFQSKGTNDKWRSVWYRNNLKLSPELQEVKEYFDTKNEQTKITQ